MNVLRSRFFQAVLIFVLAFVVLRFGIRPPAPWSVLTLYMFIIGVSLLVFVSSDRDSWAGFVRPIWLTLTEPRYRLLRSVIVVLIPLLLGYYAYTQAAAKPQAPPELRAVHPAPPGSIQFRGKEINIAGLENPLRKDASALKKHVAAGGETYIRNCVYCHGDNLDGRGHFAYGFNPPPANMAWPAGAQWSRPPSLLIFGVRPNSPQITTAMSWSSPRSYRSVRKAWMILSNTGRRWR